MRMVIKDALIELLVVVIEMEALVVRRHRSYFVIRVTLYPYSKTTCLPAHPTIKEGQTH